MSISGKHYLTVLFIVFGITGTSCIKSGSNIPNRFSLYYNALSLGEDLIQGTDTLNITQFKYILNSFNIQTQDSLILGTSTDQNTILMFDAAGTNENQFILSIEIGFDEANGFEKYSQRVGPIPDNTTPLFDSDFFGTPNNYSIVVKGTWNGESFTFNSSAVLDRTFTYPAIFLTEENETLQILTTVDVEHVFRITADSLLNPTNPATGNTIVQRFSQNIQLSAQQANEF